VIDPDCIDALAARLMGVLNADPASPLEAAIALLVVMGATSQRDPLMDHDLFAATDAYDQAVGGIARRQAHCWAPGRAEELVNLAVNRWQAVALPLRRRYAFLAVSRG
jgi:hypothetical protein